MLASEDTRRSFRFELKQKTKSNGRLNPTDTASFGKRRVALSNQVQGWLQKQSVFMPEAITYRSTHEDTSGVDSADSTVLDLPDEEAEGWKVTLKILQINEGIPTTNTWVDKGAREDMKQVCWRISREAALKPGSLAA